MALFVQLNDFLIADIGHLHVRMVRVKEVFDECGGTT